MTPERAFIRWFADKQFMVVKKHRPEVRAHLVSALTAQAIEAQRAETAKTGSVEDESAVGNADVPKGRGPKEVA